MSRVHQLSFANRSSPFRDVCVMPKCEIHVAEGVSFPLCERHLAKAWAAFEVCHGAEVPDPRPLPPENRTQLGKNGAVYFVRVGELLKIGWTQHVAHRLSSIKADAVLHVEAGTLEDERRYHQRFAEHLAHGREWFHFNDDVKKAIENIRKRTAMGEPVM